MFAKYGVYNPTRSISLAFDVASLDKQLNSFCECFSHPLGSTGKSVESKHEVNNGPSVSAMKPDVLSPLFTYIAANVWDHREELAHLARWRS